MTTCLLKLAPLQAPCTNAILSPTEEDIILSSLERAIWLIPTNMCSADVRSPICGFPVMDLGTSNALSLNESRPMSIETGVLNRKRQAEALAVAFLRNPLKIIDLEDLPRILHEGLLSRQRRNSVTILDLMKGHEDTIHLCCGLPYECRFDPMLDLRSGTPKAIVSFWGERLSKRRDFAISIIDTGVLFRENNVLSPWIREMNSGHKQVYGTRVHPSRLAIDTISKSTKLLTATRKWMNYVYRETMIDPWQAEAHLTSLLAEHFPFTGDNRGWLSKAWVKPGLLPEARVSGKIESSEIKAICCSEPALHLIKEEAQRLKIPIIPVADVQRMGERMRISNIIHAYGLAVGAWPSLHRYANWLKTCD